MELMQPPRSSCFVATVDLKLAEKMKVDLQEQGFTLSTPIHTLFSAQKKGVSCTLYESGKLTVQGKGMEEFITFYLEPEILKELSFSHPEVKVNFTSRIGIDESGKGDFFGPLCIAGVQADETRIKGLLELGVKDSKMVSDPTALKLSSKIRALCPCSIVLISPKKYNQLYASFQNLNRLLAWGHSTAIEELVTKTGCTEVIIDQFASEHVVERALAQKKLSVHLTQQVRAEADPVVAAASIVARAAFLSALKHLGELYKLEIPKGASKEVIRVGKALVEKYGPGVLEETGKLHFKTYSEIIQS